MNKKAKIKIKKININNQIIMIIVVDLIVHVLTLMIVLLKKMVKVLKLNLILNIMKFHYNLILLVSVL